ncbi:MAG: glucose-1-phosphate adenylyltransferase [Nitrospirae bacterium]|nr:glucose-1-phosphate adenylyltransferase [Nitrospirota bacterium]
MKDVFTMILAGGRGERLYPLTADRAKPAVPFGGKYRIIDITLSNAVNSGLRKIGVLVQYKSLSLDKHIRRGWNILSSYLDEYIITIPPQQRVSQEWYRGTADAIFQNLYVLEADNPAHLLVLSGDHIYKMDYSDMYRFHMEKGADATIAVIEFDTKSASSFGVLEVNEDFRIVGFEEKPKQPKTIPGNPDLSLCSMGVYLFNTDMLIPFLQSDARDESAHDFGKNIIPSMISQSRVYAYNFKDLNKKEAKYWRDIGTIDAYWEANIELTAVDPVFNLYDRKWPIRTYQGQHPPAKFVFAQEEEGGRLGIALDSIVCGGCIISGGRVQNSVISPNVRIHSYSDIRDSIVLENVEIGRYCMIKRAIIDKDIRIPPKTVIGYDPDEDKRRFHVTESGIVVVGKEGILV